MKNDTEFILKKIEDLYSKNLSKYGLNPKSVGWNTPEYQILRFAKLATITRKNKKFSINELGCGYGSMFHFFEDDIKVEIQEYFGYDLSQPMLDASKKLIPINRSKLFKSDKITTKADFSFASGTFNVKFDANDKK